jgi:hypothetical protein
VTDLRVARPDAPGPALQAARRDRFDGAHGLLAAHPAVLVCGAVPRDACTRWADGVLAARSEWTPDFDGEQFSLGRAFYTHLETDRAREYFADAAASDARVERHTPGLQAALRRILGEAAGGRVVPRPGWCGAGVHVFPSGSPVAAHGGVIHFDVEGLGAEHIARRAPALSLVVMIQPPMRGGGLRLWRALYAGDEHVDERTLGASDHVTVEYGRGDAILFDSYRLHQIEPFEGPSDRISATLHAARLDDGLWESWF